MIKALLNGILNVITGLVNVLLTPINSLIDSLFPNMSTAINQFNSFCSNYIGGTIGWFSHILPPITKNIIIIYLTFLIGYYSVSWTYTAIVKIYNVIQKIKFW